MLGEAVEARAEDASAGGKVPTFPSGAPSSEKSNVPALVSPKVALLRASPARSGGKRHEAAPPALRVATSAPPVPSLPAPLVPESQAVNRPALGAKLAVAMGHGDIADGHWPEPAGSRPDRSAAVPQAGPEGTAPKEAALDGPAPPEVLTRPRAEATASAPHRDGGVTPPWRGSPQGDFTRKAALVPGLDIPLPGRPAGQTAGRSSGMQVPATVEVAPPPGDKLAKTGTAPASHPAPAWGVPTSKSVPSPDAMPHPAEATPQDIPRPVSTLVSKSPACEAGASPAIPQMNTAGAAPAVYADAVPGGTQDTTSSSALPPQAGAIMAAADDRPATPETVLASRLAAVSPRARREAPEEEPRDPATREADTPGAETPQVETRGVLDRPADGGANPAPRLAFAARLVPLPAAAQTAPAEDQPAASAAANPTRQPQAAPAAGEKPENGSRKPTETTGRMASPAAPHASPTDTGAPFPPVAGSSVEPARTELTPPAASPVRRMPPALETAEEPVAPSPAAHEIKLQLSSSGERVEVRLVERAGDVHVAVRTPDARLADALRQDLSALASRLEQSGFRTESWHGGLAAADRRTMTEAPAAAAGQDSRSFQDGGGSQSNQQEQQQDGRRPPPGSHSQSKEDRKDFAWLFTSLR